MELERAPRLLRGAKHLYRPSSHSEGRLCQGGPSPRPVPRTSLAPLSSPRFDTPCLSASGLCPLGQRQLSFAGGRRIEPAEVLSAWGAVIRPGRRRGCRFRGRCQRTRDTACHHAVLGPGVTRSGGTSNDSLGLPAASARRRLPGNRADPFRCLAIEARKSRLSNSERFIHFRRWSLCATEQHAVRSSPKR